MNVAARVCRSPDSWPWTDHAQISLIHSPTPPKCSTRAIMALINNLGIVYHQYCSSSVTTKYALARVNKVRIEFIPAVTNLISNQLTTSLALDNSQQLIPKKIQTGGSSAVYHQAVAYFVKCDKAILLPVGAVLRSHWVFCSVLHPVVLSMHTKLF